MESERKGKVYFMNVCLDFPLNVAHGWREKNAKQYLLNFFEIYFKKTFKPC